MAGCFRDILFLKKDLRESEIERLEEDQKMRFFYKQRRGFAMECVTRKDVENLIKDPLIFAMMMDDDQLERVIVTFVSVVNKRKSDRGG